MNGQYSLADFGVNSFSGFEQGVHRLFGISVDVGVIPKVGTESEGEDDAAKFVWKDRSCV